MSMKIRKGTLDKLKIRRKWINHLLDDIDLIIHEIEEENKR